MMPLTILFLLAISAFICTVASALGKCPLWVPVILLALFALVQTVPVGR